MAVTKKDLIKMAKKTTIATKSSNKNDKNDLKKTVDPKEMVDKLLEDAKLVTIEKPEEKKTETAVSNNVINTKWLEDQVDLLTNENKILKEELAELKNNNENDLKPKVVQLFNELQNAFIQTGKSPHFRLYPIPFMGRLLELFPFLSKFKRL